MMYDKEIFEAAYGRLTRNFSVAQSQRLAALMVAQAKFESANYTSNVFKKNNNAFGYRYYAGSPYQTGVGTYGDGGSYAKYSSVSASAMEVADWLGRRKSDFQNVTTPEGYVRALKKNAYFTGSESDYIKGVKKYYNSSDTSTSTSLFTGSTPLLLLVAAGLLLLFILF